MRTRLRIGRRLGRATIGESADKQIKEARAALVSENSASQWHRTNCTVTRTRAASPQAFNERSEAAE